MSTEGHLFDMIELYDRPAVCDATGAPKAASVRNMIGHVAEEFACRALGLNRETTDGRKKACEDATGEDGLPFEIKSVGKNGRALIYAFRLKKEATEFPRGLRYVFVHHSCPVTMKRGSEVADHFRDNPPRLLSTSHAILAALLLPKPVRTFRMFTGEAGMTVAPPCEHCHGNPGPEHLGNEGKCYSCGTPPAPKFDRKKHHGSQRAGYVEGGWQFALSELTITESTTTKPFTWRGKTLTVPIDHAR